MKSFVRVAFFVLVSLALLGGCKRAPRDTLAPVRRALSTRGIPLAARLRDEGATARADALRNAASTLAPSFVLPTIQDRVTRLGASIGELRAAEIATLGERTWVALSSDGSVFVAVGGEPITPFSRPFASVESVRRTLVDGTPGSESMAWPVGSSTRAFLDVTPVNVAGATAGALLTITPYVAESTRIRDAVRRRGGALAHVELCLRGESDLACTDVPEAAQRAVTRPTFGGANGGVSDLVDGSVRGVLAAGPLSTAMPRVVLWTASPSAH